MIFRNSCPFRKWRYFWIFLLLCSQNMCNSLIERSHQARFFSFSLSITSLTNTKIWQNKGKVWFIRRATISRETIIMLLSPPRLSLWKEVWMAATTSTTFTVRKGTVLLNCYVEGKSLRCVFLAGWLRQNQRIPKMHNLQRDRVIFFFF